MFRLQALCDLLLYVKNDKILYLYKIIHVGTLEAEFGFIPLVRCILFGDLTKYNSTTNN